MRATGRRDTVRRKDIVQLEGVVAHLRDVLPEVAALRGETRVMVIVGEQEVDEVAEAGEEEVDEGEEEGMVEEDGVEDEVVRGYNCGRESVYVGKERAISLLHLYYSNCGERGSDSSRMANDGRVEFAEFEVCDSIYGGIWTSGRLSKLVR